MSEKTLKNNSHFGNKLRELRKSRGLSQAGLIKEIRRFYPSITIKQSRLSQIESTSHLPRHQHMEWICDYFDVGYSYLMGNDMQDTELSLRERGLLRLLRRGQHLAAIRLIANVFVRDDIEEKQS